mmetsp:Transcript_6737/g.11581  ORF Transcript_6737/g.11581 Transcript_6737/m.11581 type:complete len:242 (+) Transcript_6737:139-864(+)
MKRTNAPLASKEESKEAAQKPAGKAPALKNRNELHIARKIFHSTGGSLIALGVSRHLDKWDAIRYLGIAFFVMLCLETYRLRFGSANARFVRMFGSLLREHEAKKASTVCFFLSGVILALVFFPREIAFQSILHLAYGDPLASTFGILGGRAFGWKFLRLPTGKSLLGTMAASIASGLASAAILRFLNQPHHVLYPVLAGLAGGVAEILPLGIDDNFVIPVMSACSLGALYSFFKMDPVYL